MSLLQSPVAQSALHPAGLQAARIYGLWEFLLGTATVVFDLNTMRLSPRHASLESHA